MSKIIEAESGESKFEFFKRAYTKDTDITLKFNSVKVEIQRNTPDFVLAGRLHDALCRIEQLESQYRR
jgi:hypothetical protein